MSHARFLRLVRDHFLEGLSEEQHGELRRHLRECEECRAEYDATAILLRGAAEKQPTHRENEAWARHLRVKLHPDEPAPARRRQYRGWLAPALAAGVLVVVGAVLLLKHDTPPTRPAPGVQLRGGDAVTPLVDIEVFAIAPGTPPRPRRVKDGGEVGLGEFVQFRYRNHSTRVRHLYLLGVDARGRVLDYFPRPGQTHSIAIQEALSPLPAARSIRLASRHQPGALWIVAIFSERPLSREQVHGKLRGLEGVDLGRASFGEGVYVMVHPVKVAPRRESP
jgi:hypothetical protein